MNLNSEQKVLIQGITGQESAYWVRRMVEYGTNIVAGTSPGRGGMERYGIPVYNTVKAALREHQIDTSIIFVPPDFTLGAALEAIEGGVKQLIILVDGVPVHHTMKIISLAEIYGVTVFGPNTPGMVFPGSCSLGIMPCWLGHLFRPGKMAILSRSGSLGNEICYQVSKTSLGISKFIGIGGDALVGTTFIDLLLELDKDDTIEGIIIVGELGGNMEETAAAYIPNLNKMVFAYITGKTAPLGVPMGHAGAIIEGSAGSSLSKIKILQNNGAVVFETPDQIPGVLRQSFGIKG